MNKNKVHPESELIDILLIIRLSVYLLLYSAYYKDLIYHYNILGCSNIKPPN